MALKSVTYCATSRLSCANCTPADVVICISESPGKVVQSPCFPEEVTTNTTLTTFDATLISFTMFNGSCNSKVFKYTFQYDDSILVDVDDPITTEDITGVFCKGCLHNWVEEKVGAEVYIRDNEDGTLTLVTPHGCEYTWEGALV